MLSVIGASMNMILVIAAIGTYLAGIIICSGKLKLNAIYKFGLWFFILRLAIDVFDLLKAYVIIPLIVRNSAIPQNYGVIINYLNLPYHILGIISYILLVMGLYNGFKNNMNNRY